MAKNSIQMQKGLSFNKFLSTYGTNRQCEAAVEKSKWPVGFCCTKCGCDHAYVYRKKTVKVFQCRSCRKQETLTENTIFQSTKLTLIQWFQGMYLMTQSKNNVSILELKRHLGIGYKSAWRLKHKLMQVMYERESDTKLSGRVEVDDAYLGGELRGGKSGRGSENKIPFVAAVQTDKNNHPIYVVFSQVKGFTLDEIRFWARYALAPGTVVVSDGLSCFPAVEDVGCFHQRVVVGTDQKSVDMECFSWINTILGNLKTAIAGTYHAFDFKKYGHRYLGEVQYKFNRRFDLSIMLQRLVYAAANTGCRPERFLRQAEA
jgi:hypothetical protein